MALRAATADSVEANLAQRAESMAATGYHFFQ